MEVLNRSSEIAVLQSRLTELIIQSPGSAVALPDLKKVMESVELKRFVVTNGDLYNI